MKIYPAIDIKGGKCVRLLRGSASDETVYGDPLDAARRWKSEGAERLHIVDLDGAFQGQGSIEKILRGIIAETGLPVQTGGGIRTLSAIESRLAAGVDRVILGTAAAKDPALAKEAARLFPGRIIAGIDCRDGYAAINGWVEKTDLTGVELALRMKDAGITAVIYTDVSRDGTGLGVNLDATRKMVEETGMEIIASGGIGGPGDVRAVRETGADGVIIGKALYDGRITLAEAIKEAE